MFPLAFQESSAAVGGMCLTTLARKSHQTNKHGSSPKLNCLLKCTVLDGMTSSIVLKIVQAQEYGPGIKRLDSVASVRLRDILSCFQDLERRRVKGAPRKGWAMNRSSMHFNSYHGSSRVHKIFFGCSPISFENTRQTEQKALLCCTVPAVSCLCSEKMVVQFRCLLCLFRMQYKILQCIARLHWVVSRRRTTRTRVVVVRNAE